MENKKENKHAYLIMAYNNWNQLSLLLKLLDDYRNDIFIHIDLRSGDFPKDMLVESVRESKIVFIPRKKVYWADYSQADVEMDLLHAASNNQKYRYYHLLSGMDLPLKNQDEIHDFFDNKECEFIAMTPDGGDYVEKHTCYYHWLLHNRFYRKCKTLKVLDRGLMYVQRILGLKRVYDKDLLISTGWQWFSITNEFCKYVLSQRDFIKKMFSYVLDVDEKFIGTMVNKGGFHNKLYHMCPPGGTNKDFMIGCQRMIDFDCPVPQPYTWGRENAKKDFDMLINSGFLFARKFDENTNNEIVQLIYNHIMDIKKEN